MTVKAFLEKMQTLDTKMKSPNTDEKYSDFMAARQEIWSNSAAIGYLIRAAKNLDMPREQILALVDEMKYALGGLSIEDAKRIYNDF